MRSLPILSAGFFLFATNASAQLELKAAKSPSGKNQWEQPAQISYLSNSGGESSSAINAAVSSILPNIPKTTIQAQVTAWIAKNSMTTRKQDKRGIEASVYMALGSAQFGYLPQVIASVDRDRIKHTDERTYEATVDFTSVPLNLGGCGNAVRRGCTYWNAMAGFYSNDVRSSTDDMSLGRLSGTRLLIQATSSPFPEGTALAQLGFSASAQAQWDHSASQHRIKQNRHLYKASMVWKFYTGTDKYKPSIALERVRGSDLFTGLENQAYTQLALRLEI